LWPAPRPRMMGDVLPMVVPPMGLRGEPPGRVMVVTRVSSVATLPLRVPTLESSATSLLFIVPNRSSTLRENVLKVLVSTLVCACGLKLALAD